MTIDIGKFFGAGKVSKILDDEIGGSYLTETKEITHEGRLDGRVYRVTTVVTKIEDIGSATCEHCKKLCHGIYEDVCEYCTGVDAKVWCDLCTDRWKKEQPGEYKAFWDHQNEMIRRYLGK